MYCWEDVARRTAAVYDQVMEGAQSEVAAAAPTLALQMQAASTSLPQGSSAPAVYHHTPEAARAAAAQHTLLARLGRYCAAGRALGLLFAVAAVLAHWWWALLRWMQPEEVVLSAPPPPLFMAAPTDVEDATAPGAGAEGPGLAHEVGSRQTGTGNGSGRDSGTGKGGSRGGGSSSRLVVGGKRGKGGGSGRGSG